jgi:hypothetical protein
MTKNFIRIAAVLIVAATLASCDSMLEEETFSSLGPTNFYNSAEDAEALLNSVYANSQGYRDILRDYLTFGEFTTDIAIERQGAINALTQPIEDFRFEATHPWLEGLWARYYSAIYRANVLLDHVPNIAMNAQRRDQILAEARFLRAFNYFYLYDLFGPVPILQTSETSVSDRPSRPTDEEFVAFLESELRAVAGVLPRTQAQRGRATSGAALGFLTKFQLNKKKWSEAAATAQEIIQSGQYSIFNAGNRTDLFALGNKRNSEFIYEVSFPDNPTGDLGNTYLSHAAPPGYRWKFPPKVKFAANFKLRTAFVNTFEPGDERRDALVFTYVNNAGNTVVLGPDDVRSFKYPEDPNGVGDVSGNDVPLVRYADILLSRAEALNELSGPTQEAIDLINQVREAAGVAPITPGQYGSGSALRDFILEERGREFHTEALRRQDLIRHGVFIQKARERGKPAADYQVLFPIPQSEINRNANLQQNPGY